MYRIVLVFRVELEKYENEDGGFVKNQKAVRMCLNNAIGTFYSLVLSKISKTYFLMETYYRASEVSPWFCDGGAMIDFSLEILTNVLLMSKCKNHGKYQKYVTIYDFEML